MIRMATDKDNEALARIGNRYAQETLMGELTSPQLQDIISVCMNMGIVLVAEKEGVVVGLIGGRFVSGDQMTMGMFFEEVIWYVEPENRGLGLLLYKDLMRICEERGCKGIAMTAYCNKHLPAVERLYIKSGFKELERKYYKTF